MSRMPYMSLPEFRNTPEFHALKNEQEPEVIPKEDDEFEEAAEEAKDDLPPDDFVPQE